MRTQNIRRLHTHGLCGANSNNCNTRHALATSIHESYVDAHGNKVAEDAVFKSPGVAIIFDEAPQYGMPSRSMKASIR